jgi:DNA-binding SARP family transcriptional activator/tetratricopeptide (TPR) repeat protein
VDLRVLGALEVWHDERLVSLRAAKPRQLLAILASRPDEPSPPDVLIDELWEGHPPTTAASALRTHVTQVRRALEPDRSPEANSATAPSTRLPLAPAGYVLRVKPAELDSQRFESLLGAACEANELGDPANAARQLTDALTLWRGPPLADAHGLSAVAAEVARLEQLHVRAIEQLAEARLALGEHAALVNVLVDAVDEHPLHETFAAQLMLALYRSGRQAEALRVFGRLAEQLDQQLGIPPSARLRELEEGILLQSADLDHVAPTRNPSTPAPSMLLGPRLVGRRAELDRLLDAHERATVGERSLVVVSGGAGIGKTTLAAQFGERARALGASVFVGTCDEDHTGPDAIDEILSAVANEADEEMPTALADLRGTIDAPGIDPHRVGTDLENELLRRLQAIASAIGAVGTRPIVLIVEDLHWAGRMTLLALRHLIRLSDLENLLVVATVRDEDLAPEQAQMIADLAPAARTQVIELAGLNDHEVRSMIKTSASPRAALVDLAPNIRDATDGNPLFIRVLLRDLVEQSTDDRHALNSHISTAAPDGVRLMITRRIDKLPLSTRDVLHAAALLGPDFSLTTVGEICAIERDTAIEAIEELLASRIIVETAVSVDRFTFAHALVRNAVYAGIPDDRREALHRRTAETLEAQFASAESPDAAVIAHHYYEAGSAVKAEDAADWSERAGSQAARRLAFAEAAQWYERAINLRAVTDNPCGANTLFAFALACDGARDYARAQAAYLAAAGAARDAGDAEMHADIAIAAAPVWASDIGPHAEVQQLVEDALLLIGANDPRRRIRLLARLVTLLHYSDPLRQGLVVGEIDAVAREQVDGTTVASALLARRMWLTHDPTARRERLQLAERAFGYALEGASHTTQLRVQRELLSDLIENGDIDGFDQGLADYEARAIRAASARDIYWSTALGATHATLHGDLLTAEQLTRGARLRGRGLYQDFLGAEVLQHFVIRFEQGRLSELVGGFRQSVEQRPAYRAGSALSAVACAETGHLDDALRIVRWAIGPDGTSLQRDMLWIGAHSFFCGVAAKAGDAELAALLYDILDPCAEHVVGFGSGGAMLGTVHYWRGLAASTAGRLDSAADHFETAIEMSEAMRAPFWAAQARVDLAATLVKGGAADAATIRDLADPAVAIARQRGFGRILNQVGMPI